MDAPLNDSTVTEQRAVIRLLLLEVTKPAEIYRRMSAQYGVLHEPKSFYPWVDMFTQGRKFLINRDLGDQLKCLQKF